MDSSADEHVSPEVHRDSKHSGNTRAFRPLCMWRPFLRVQHFGWVGSKGDQRKTTSPPPPRMGIPLFLETNPIYSLPDRVTKPHCLGFQFGECGPCQPPLLCYQWMSLSFDPSSRARMTTAMTLEEEQNQGPFYLVDVGRGATI